MKHKVALIALAAIAASSAQAVILGVYEFGSGAFTAQAATFVPAGVVFSTLNSTGSSISGTNLFVSSSSTNTAIVGNFVLNTAPAANAISVNAAVTNNSYFQFTITPNVGETLNLTSISFDAAKGGPSNRGVGVASSADAFATLFTSGTYNATTGVDTVRTTYTNYTFDLSSISGVTTATTIRLYVWGASTGTTVFFDNITVNGNFAAVPEPSSFAALAGVAGLGLVGLRRGRRQVA